MLPVKEFGDGESFVDTDVRTERVGAQRSPVSERFLPKQPVHSVERKSRMAGDPILIEIRETLSWPTFVPTGVENDGALLRKLPVPRLPCFEVVDAYRVIGVLLSLTLYIDYYAEQKKILWVKFVRSGFAFVEMAWGAPVSSGVLAD
jgi:hypothetical protein